jgi:hypothetical protein
MAFEGVCLLDYVPHQSRHFQKLTLLLTLDWLLSEVIKVLPHNFSIRPTIRRMGRLASRGERHREPRTQNYSNDWLSSTVHELSRPWYNLMHQNGGQRAACRWQLPDVHNI